MVRDVQPLPECLADGDVRPWVPLRVHLTLQADQLDLGIRVGRAGLPEPPVLPRKGVPTGVDDHSERTVRSFLDVSLGAAPACRHAVTIRGLVPLVERDLDVESRSC